MRNIILTMIVVALTLVTNAQEVATDSVYVSNVDIFVNSEVKQPKKQVTKVFDTERKNVVPVPNKTADEIYTMVEIAIAKFWKNPDEVIEGKSAGKYIKIRGGGSNVHTNVLGTVFSYTTTTTYMIQFKEGKFMYTVSSETKIPPSQYNSGFVVPTTLKTNRKNGKPIKLAINDLNVINAGINGFINMILESDPESGLDSDW